MFGEVTKMPTYDFKCKECSHRFTDLVPMDQRDKVKCPQCGYETEQLFTWGGNFSVSNSAGACETSKKFT